MLYDTLLRRRSIRQFEDREVEVEKVARLLRAALLSPSSRNIRPWEIIAVTDREIIRRLARAKPHGAAFLSTAPLAVVVAAETAASDVWVEDTSIVSCLLLLMADELDLGACWCQIRKRDTEDGRTACEYVRRELGLPERFRVEAVVGIGYAAETRPPYDEEDLKMEKLHFNRFGVPFVR